MEILSFFNRDDYKEVKRYQLKPDDFDNLLVNIVEKFRQAYIEDEELTNKSKINKISEKSFLEKYVLPDIGNIISGDFGEILSFYVVQENSFSKGKTLVGPLKWRWKERNKPSPHTDVIQFYVKEKGKASKEDILVTAESKMKATSTTKSPIQNAIDGATNDKLSRMSKTLFWLEEKYAKEGDVQNKEVVERFSNPSKHETYNKIHKAIAIIDSKYVADELNEPRNNPEDITVIVFSINELQNLYESTRIEILSSVEDDE